jgi:hypothetical protein
MKLLEIHADEDTNQRDATLHAHRHSFNKNVLTFREPLMQPISYAFAWGQVSGLCMWSHMDRCP